jgi:hypothetical protein
MKNLLQKLLTTNINSKIFENPYCGTHAKNKIKKYFG